MRKHLRVGVRGVLVLFGLSISLVGAGAGCRIFDSEDKPAPDLGATSPDGGGPDALGGTPEDRALTLEVVPRAFVPQSGSVKIVVKARRGRTLIRPITLRVKDLRADVTAPEVTIPSESSEGELTLSASAAAPQGALPAATIEAFVEDDGQTILAASTALDVVVRGAPGGIDTTFASSGIQSKIFGQYAFAKPREVVVAPDDKVLVLANCTENQGYACIARLLPDGAIDTSFGTQGKREYGWHGASAMALQADEKIVFVGGSGTNNTVLARATKDGEPDATFGTASLGPGTRMLGVGSGNNYDANALSIGPTGEIGISFDWYISSYSVGVARLSANGVTVLSGPSSGTWAGGSVPTGVGLRADGRLVAVGAGGDGAGAGCGALQIGTNGAYDPTFGDAATPGRVFKAVSGTRRGDHGVTRLALLPDGAVVAPFRATNGVYLVKFTADGKLDGTFGTSGVSATTDLGGEPSAIALDASGRFIVSVAASNKIVLARYSSTGALDPSFGTNGVATHDMSGTSLRAVRLALQKDGRIVVALLKDVFTDTDVTVVRLWP